MNLMWVFGAEIANLAAVIGASRTGAGAVAGLATSTVYNFAQTGGCDNATIRRYTKSAAPISPTSQALGQSPRGKPGAFIRSPQCK
jgi:hypothetical protein